MTVIIIAPFAIFPDGGLSAQLAFPIAPKTRVTLCHLQKETVVAIGKQDLDSTAPEI